MVAATTSDASGAAILARVLEPDNASLSPEAARSLLAFDFKAADIARMNDLAEESRQGRLSESEEQELQNYMIVGHLLDFLHSKARQSLRHHGQPI